MVTYDNRYTNASVKHAVNMSYQWSVNGAMGQMTEEATRSKMTRSDTASEGVSDATKWGQVRSLELKVVDKQAFVSWL